MNPHLLFAVNFVLLAIVVVFLYYAYVVPYIAERPIRRTIHKLHERMTDPRAPLRILPELRRLAVRHSGNTSTLVAGNDSLVALYSKAVYDERFEEETLRIGPHSALQDGNWRIRITWFHRKITKWSVNGKDQLVPVPKNLRDERYLLTNMLCAVKVLETDTFVLKR